MYKIKEVNTDRSIKYNTIAGLEEIIFSSYGSERSNKIFSNKDHKFRIETVGNYYLKEISIVKQNEIPVILSMFEKMDCKIFAEYAGMADSYVIESDKKIFKVRELNYKYMYLLPTFNDHKLAMFVSNDENTFKEYKEAIENV